MWSSKLWKHALALSTLLLATPASAGGPPTASIPDPIEKLSTDAPPTPEGRSAIASEPPTCPLTLEQLSEHCRATLGHALKKDKPRDDAIGCYRLLETKLSALSVKGALSGSRRKPRAGKPAKIAAVVQAEQAYEATSKALGELLLVLSEKNGDAYTHASKSSVVKSRRRAFAKKAQAAAYALQIANGVVQGRSALVVRGGVSMGAYQGGVAFVLTELFRIAGRGLPRRATGLDVSVGTSAGAVNAAYAAKASCEKGELTAAESDFLATWRKLGMRGERGGLLAKDVRDARAVLSKGVVASEVARLQVKLAGKTFDPECRTVLGLTATRLEPKTFSLTKTSGPELQIPLQEERFSFELEGQSDGALRISSTRPPIPDGFTRKQRGQLRAVYSQLYPALKNGESQEGLWALMMQVVAASGTFPIAFAPERFGVDDNDAFTLEGDSTEVEQIELIDGGVFDSQPIGLAVDLSRIPQARRRQATQCPTEFAGVLPESAPTEFFLVEPTLTTYSISHATEKSLRCAGRGASKCLLGTYLPFIGGFLNSARATKLVETIERFPFLAIKREGLGGNAFTILPRSYPIAGEHLGHFFAFFEEDFRVFDFYVGLVDGVQQMSSHAIWGDGPELQSLKAELQEDLYYRCANNFFTERGERTSKASFRDAKQLDGCANLLRRTSNRCPESRTNEGSASCVLPDHRLTRGTKEHYDAFGKRVAKHARDSVRADARRVDEFREQAAERAKHLSINEKRLAELTDSTKRPKRTKLGRRAHKTEIAKLTEQITLAHHAQLKAPPPLESSTTRVLRSQLAEINFVRLLVATANLKAELSRKPDLNAFRFYLSELDRVHFQFIDLRMLAEERLGYLNKIDARRVLALVRELMTESISSLADRQQPPLQKGVVSVIGKAGINLASSMGYHHPHHVLSLAIAVKGLDLQYWYNIPQTRRFHTAWHVAFGLRGSKLERTELAVPNGLERGPTIWKIDNRLYGRLGFSGPCFFGACFRQRRWAGIFQTRFGFGYGVQGTTGARAEGGKLRDGTAFLRHGVEAAVNLSLFQRVRIEFYALGFLDPCGPAGIVDKCYRSGTTTRSELNLDTIQLGINLGWNWLFERRQKRSASEKAWDKVEKKRRKVDRKDRRERRKPTVPGY